VIYYGQEKENRSKEENRNQNHQEKEGQEIIPAILFLDLVQRQQSLRYRMKPGGV
jgi:hypothetical protein